MNPPTALNFYHEPLFSLEKLYRAYRQCRRGKRSTSNALIFEQNLEENLLVLHQQLITGTYQPGRSIAFLVKKPKMREIFAADFADRVIHHLLVSYLEPQWEKRFIHDSCACRKNKGTLAAVERLTRFSRQISANNTRPAWYLQLDIRGFFININRPILYQRLQAKEKNPAVLWLIRQVLFNEPTENCLLKGHKRADFLLLPAHKTLFKAQPECGLPIGNLTSQFFANVYLDALDQFVKHQLKARYYVRYCDDFILLSASRTELEQHKQSIATFLGQTLSLTLNPIQKLQRLSNGMNFLGYIIRSDYRLVRNRVVGNLYERLMAAEQHLRHQGMVVTKTRAKLIWDWPMLSKLKQSINSYYAHFAKANSYKLVTKIIKRFDWLNYFFIWQMKGRQIMASFRYPVARYYPSFKQQVRYLLQSLPGHLCVIEVGLRYQIYDCEVGKNETIKAVLVQTLKIKLTALLRLLTQWHENRVQNITLIRQSHEANGQIIRRKISTQWLLYQAL